MPETNVMPDGGRRDGVTEDKNPLPEYFPSSVSNDWCRERRESCQTNICNEIEANRVLLVEIKDGLVGDIGVIRSDISSIRTDMNSVKTDMTDIKCQWASWKSAGLAVWSIITVFLSTGAALLGIHFGK